MEKKYTVKRKDIIFFLLLLVCFLIWFSISIYSANLFIYRVIVAVIMVYCIYKGTKESTLFNPYYFFTIVPFTLMIYDNRISTHYLRQLDAKLWIFAIVNMIAFLFTLTITQNGKTNVKKNIPQNDCIKHSIFMFGIYFIFQLMWAFFDIMLPLYSVIQLFLYPAVACAWKSKKKTLIVFEYIVFLLVAINKMNKTILLFIGIVTVYSYWKYYMNEKKITIKMIAVGIAFLVLMLVMFDYKTYLTETDGDFISYISGDAKEYSFTDRFIDNGTIKELLPRPLIMPYMYLVQAWNNLQFVMDTQPDMTYGLWFVKPIIGYVGLEENFTEVYQGLNAYSFFNTYTYLTVFFKDFGYYFAWLGSAFLGFYIKVFYNKFLTSKSPWEIACYGMISCATIQMFFSNHFFQQSYPFTIAFLMIIYEFFFVKNRNEASYDK